MVKLEFSLEETQLVLNALGELPHKLSRGLIDKVYAEAKKVEEDLKTKKEE